MGFRLGLVFLMTMVFVAAATEQGGIYYRSSTDHGLVEDALALDEKLMMDSETARRQLAGGRGGYISYGALDKNRVPCNRRGRSYYNCRGHEKANSYSRGCTRATSCARNNH